MEKIIIRFGLSWLATLWFTFGLILISIFSITIAFFDQANKLNPTLYQDLTIVATHSYFFDQVNPTWIEAVGTTILIALLVIGLLCLLVSILLLRLAANFWNIAALSYSFGLCVLLLVIGLCLWGLAGRGLEGVDYAQKACPINDIPQCPAAKDAPAIKLFQNLLSNARIFIPVGIGLLALSNFGVSRLNLKRNAPLARGRCDSCGLNAPSRERRAACLLCREAFHIEVLTLLGEHPLERVCRIVLVPSQPDWPLHRLRLEIDLRRGLRLPPDRASAVDGQGWQLDPIMLDSNDKLRLIGPEFLLPPLDTLPTLQIHFQTSLSDALLPRIWRQIDHRLRRRAYTTTIQLHWGIQTRSILWNYAMAKKAIVQTDKPIGLLNPASEEFPSRLNPASKAKMT